MKTYILDTNVLMHDWESLLSFQENNVVIPLVVIEEMDNHKKERDELGYNVRSATRFIDKLREKGDISKGVPLGEGLGALRVDARNVTFKFAGLKDCNDNLILGCTQRIMDESGDTPVILVTKDTGLRIKADSLGITAQDYLGEKHAANYVGRIQEIELPEEIRSLIFNGGGTLNITTMEDIAEKGGKYHIPDGQCAMITNGPALVRRKGDLLYRISGKLKPKGITHKNYEQSALIDVLMDKDIDMVICAGVAGSGKTLLSMAAGIDQVESGQFDRVLITKAIMPVGNDIGYTKGDKKEKMSEWLKPFYDNLELIMRDQSKKRKDDKKHSNVDADDEFDELIEIDAITYIRGRSLMYRYVIIDEIQNLTPKIMKTIVSRIHDSAKLILLGDLQQIDNPFLDERNNGLAYMMNRMEGAPGVAILQLEKTERGRLAQLAIDRL